MVKLELDAGVVEIAEPRERADLHDVDASVRRQRIVGDMYADDLADDDVLAAVGEPLRHRQGREQPAFELDRRQLDPRRAHQARRHHLEPGERGLVDLRRVDARRDVHLLAQRPGRHVDDELAGAVDVARRVRPRSRREHDVRRIVAEILELAERGEVLHALWAQRRDPGDRARHADRLERVKWQTVIVLFGLVEHRPSLARAGTDMLVPSSAAGLR